MKFSFSKNIISVNGFTVEFSSNVDKVIELNDRLIVLLDFSAYDEPRNIIAIGRGGEEIWSIEKIDAGPLDKKSVPFSGLDLRSDGVLIAYHLGGFHYEVSVDDGSVKKIGGGRPW